MFPLKMVIFNSYVSLPEGIMKYGLIWMTIIGLGYCLQNWDIMNYWKYSQRDYVYFLKYGLSWDIITG